MRRSLAAVSCAALFAFAGAAPALAGDDGVPLAVELGSAVERNVGNANGWFCDDPALVDAKIVTRAESNYWVARATRVGSTRCRVGTDPSRYTVVFDITVQRPRPKQGRAAVR